jgi:hypothetical protein
LNVARRQLRSVSFQYPVLALNATLNADHMPDDTPIRPLGARMVCSRCGYGGADVRPDWSPHVNKRRLMAELKQ